MKPVLGLFADERELRDELALRLELLEPGLALLDTEYPLTNPDGSGGRIDILARDSFDHLLCIEIKRSDNSARGTLNELSKYVSLLVERDRVPRETIRCIVVSTHWDELLLPLSYFAYSAGVDVTASEAVCERGQLAVHPVELKALKFLPQFSPDMDLFHFDAPGPRESFIAFMKERSKCLPFVRLALLLFETSDPRVPSYPLVVGVWRIADGHHASIEAVMGEAIGHDFPYAAPGWEPEADAKNWIGDIGACGIREVAEVWTHGTSEKVQSLTQRHRLTRVERLGDWPKIELVNDDARILRAVLSGSPLAGNARPNRHSYHQVATPGVAPSWAKACEGFLDFLAFEPLWEGAARRYLASLGEARVSVELYAFDKKHLVYGIHQAQVHEDTMLGHFSIVVRSDNSVIDGLLGYYAWDGKTCPVDAAATIDTIYGSGGWARLSFQSAVDEQRYEVANSLHGFSAVVRALGEAGLTGQERDRICFPLRDFVAEHPDYCRSVSEVLEAFGPLPTDPSG